MQIPHAFDGLTKYSDLPADQRPILFRRVPSLVPSLKIAKSLLLKHVPLFLLFRVVFILDRVSAHRRALVGTEHREQQPTPFTAQPFNWEKGWEQSGNHWEHANQTAFR